MKKILGSIIVISVLVSAGAVISPARAQSAVVGSPKAGGERIAPELQATLDSLGPGEMTTAIVTMRDQAELAHLPGANRAARLQGVIRALQAHTAASQRQVQALLVARQAQGLVGGTTSFWVFSGLSVTAVSDVFRELAARDDVATITPDTIQAAPAMPQAAAAPEPNLSVVNAPALWELGFRGQGVVVANMDTGVSASHPDLTTRWRGGSNSWYDPYGEHPATPTDLSGHGTQTMGIMVAGDASGASIGVAPQATWIAVKIFNDQGSATATAIHQGFQWLLDPDGNPSTADAPHVVNNSWTYGSPGCNLEFQLDLQSLGAAGILPIFSAGNYGPGGSTSVSPANYPEAFAVGASNNADQLYGYSSRGPSACGEAPATYPEIVAPGVNVTTTDLYGSYAQATGTSLSAPHVAGALALLMNAYPNLSAAQQRAALLSGAVDLGAVGPDNDFGYGRLNVLGSYQWLQAGGANPTPTPSPTPTATPAPTSTPAPATTLHVGDLDRSAARAGSKLNATVTVYVHDAGEKLVANATVYGIWTNGTTGSVSCVTHSGGACQVTKKGLGAKTTSVTFTVTNLTHATMSYTPTSNHDPDGDSDGSLITIPKP